jgi:hypothetical protein
MLLSAKCNGKVRVENKLYKNPVNTLIKISK